MSDLNYKINLEKEMEFILKSMNFLRPPLKQIDNSLHAIKRHYKSNGVITIVPQSSPSHLARIQHSLLRYLEKDSKIYEKNIVTDSLIEQTDDRGLYVPSLLVLMDSLALVMDIEISPRPSDVHCDVLLAICGQPVIVLTIVDGDKDSKAVRRYNTSVANGVSKVLFNFMDESMNVVYGVLDLKNLDTLDTFHSIMVHFAKGSSNFVTGKTLLTYPSKYRKIVTAFWAGVAQTTSVISRDGLVDTDYLRFLTKDQCVILLENINKRVVEVEFNSDTGATTLMIEVAKRLSRLGGTLLVCKSIEKKDRLRKVFSDTLTPDDLTTTDLSRYASIVDETGTVTGHFNGKLWRFTRGYCSSHARYDEIALVLMQRQPSVSTAVQDLQNSVKVFRKRNADMEKLILLISSGDRTAKMAHLLVEMKTLKILDIIITGLISNSSIPTFLAHESPVKQSLTTKQLDDEDREERLETKNFISHIIHQVKDRIHERKDLLSLLVKMIARSKTTISYLQTKMHILETAMSDTQRTEYKIRQAADTAHETRPQLFGVNIQATSTTLSNSDQGRIPGVITGMADEENIADLRNELEILKKEAALQATELQEQTDVSGSLVEWEYSMDSLSQDMSALRTLNLEQLIGEDLFRVITERQSNMTSFYDDDSSVRKHKLNRCRVHQMRQLQLGDLNSRHLMEIVRDVTTTDHERLAYLQTRSDNLEKVYGCPINIVGEIDSVRSGPVSCPTMKLSKDRVFCELSVSGKRDQYLTNTIKSGTDHSPNRFTRYFGTCSDPILIPSSLSTPTVSQYWETSTNVQRKNRGTAHYLLEIGLVEALACLDSKIWEYGPSKMKVMKYRGDRDSIWVSGLGGSGWSVEVYECDKHQGFCTQVWGDGKRVGDDCLSTTPWSHTLGTGDICLGTVVDVGRGRLAFIDIFQNKVLHKFDVTFRQPVYPVFGMWPLSDNYDITMRLFSGREISFTYCKGILVAEALFSD